MATRYIHSVTLEDGRIATRTSTSRVYTHAVVVKYPETARGWNNQPHHQAGREVVLTFSGSLQRGLAAMASERNRLQRIPGTQGATLRLAEVRMEERESGTAPMRQFTVTDTITGNSVVVEAINAKRAKWAGWEVLGPGDSKDWDRYHALAVVLTMTAKDLAASKGGK